MMYTATTIVILAVLTIVLAWMARLNYGRYRDARDRQPIPPEHISAETFAKGPWEQPYRGQLWPDPRSSASDLSREQALAYCDLASRHASLRRLLAEALLLILGAALGSEVSAIAVVAPEVPTALLILTGTTVAAAGLALRIKGMSADHWVEVASLYAQRAESLRSPPAPDPATGTSLALAERNLPARIWSAFEAARREFRRGSGSRK